MGIPLDATVLRLRKIHAEKKPHVAFSRPWSEDDPDGPTEQRTERLYLKVCMILKTIRLDSMFNNKKESLKLLLNKEKIK